MGCNNRQVRSFALDTLKTIEVLADATPPPKQSNERRVLINRPFGYLVVQGARELQAHVGSGHMREPYQTRGQPAVMGLSTQ